MSKLKFFILSLFLVASLFTISAASAQNVTDTLTGLDITAGKITAYQSQTGGPLDKFGSAFFATRVGQIIGLVLSFIGILFLGLMIYAGISWMTAGGNEQRVTSAKDLMINATIGIVIVFGAYAITAFLGNQFVQ